MRRILLVTNRYPCDADDPASPFVPHFVESLRSLGVGVDVLTPRYTHRPPTREPDYVHRFHTGTALPVGSWNLAAPSSWIRLRRFMIAGQEMGRTLCRSNRYDHIFALWALPSGEFARRLAREFFIPYSTWCLGSDIYAWARRPVIRGRIANVLRGSANVFADGDDLCERVRNWLGIGCQFLPTFRPLAGSLPDHPPAAAESPRFLYLGRIHAAKGTGELLRAFAQVARTLPGSRLTYVGDGPDLASLRRLAEKLALGHSVTFAGSVGRDEILSAYRDSDFVVIPTKSDSLPLVFSEAVQARRPVIGTAVGDLGAFIRRFQVGLVCRSAEPSLLAAAMVQMAREPLFSDDGRERLLKLLDPRAAALAFCRRAYGVNFTPAKSAISRDLSTKAPDASVVAHT